MRWGLALALIVVAAIVIATRCRSDQSTREATVVGAKSGSAKRATLAVRGAITGVVIDEARAPIAGALVCTGGSEPICIRGDAHGAFRLELPEGEHRVSASAPKFRATSKKAQLGAHLELILRGGAVEITGTVSDLTGGPIGGALVNSDDGFAETDASGRYSIWVESSPVTLFATATGYARDHAYVRGPTSVNFELTPESTLSGIVVDERTNAPVPNFHVEAIGDPDGVATSGEDGRFRITGLGPARYWLQGSGPGYRASRQAAVRLGLADGKEVRLLASTAFRISGRVLIANTQQPCTEGKVQDEELSSDGRVTLDGLLAGVQRLSIECRGYQGRVVTPSLDKDVDGLTWTVGDGVEVTGHVRTGAEKPVVDAEIVLSAPDLFARVKTDASGFYRIRGVVDGKYKLSVNSRSWTEHPIEVRGASVEHDFTIDTVGTAVIKGIVVDTNRRPVANLLVSTDLTNGQFVNDDTDGAGSFALQGLSPGKYTIRVIDRRREELRKGSNGQDDVAEIAIADGEVKHVELVVETTDRSIRGSVTDSRGKPVGDVFVIAFRTAMANPAECEWFSMGSDRHRRLTSRTGSFVISDLPSGTYCVRAFQRGGQPGPVQRVEVDSTVTLVLDPAASVEGTVKLADGRVPTSFTVAIGPKDWRQDSFANAEGRFRIDDVAVGSSEVVVTTPTASWFGNITTTSRETTSLNVTVQPGATVTGRIIELATKQPLVSRVAATRRDARTKFGLGTRVTTDSAGRFKLENVPVGPVVLIIDPLGEWGRSINLVRTIPPAQPSVDLGDVVVLKPRTSSGDEGYLGFTLVENPTSWFIDRIQVGAIDPEGPAVKSGLRVGDIITAVDGVDVRGERAGFYHALVIAPVGTKLTFTLARGSTIEIVLLEARY